MTHLMQWQAATQQIGPVRRWAVVLLRALSRAIDSLVVELDTPRAVALSASVEFATVEMGGRTVGAYYINGELAGIVPDAMRL
jgi:hypothetical protein